jgi:integrase
MSEEPVPPRDPPRLLETVRAALALRHRSPRTQDTYVAWVRRFVIFAGRRHPRDLGPGEVRAFLSALATQGRVSAPTNNQALAALLFRYRDVLGAPIEGQLEGVVPAKRPTRLPTVLSRDEVREVLARLEGVPLLVALLLYGSGLRLLEALSLRIKTSTSRPASS